jgi:hypothetical protein
MAAAQRPPRKRLRVSQVFVSDTHMEPLAGFGQPRAAYKCAASANDGGCASTRRAHVAAGQIAMNSCR